MPLIEITGNLALPTLTQTMTPVNKSGAANNVIEALLLPTLIIINVSWVPVEGIALNVNTLALLRSKTGTLIATVTPAGATTKTVTWASSDNTIATVVDGLVTGILAGTAIITVTTTDGGFTDTCTVTVSEPSVDPVPIAGSHGANDITQFNITNGNLMAITPGTFTMPDL